MKKWLDGRIKGIVPAEPDVVGEGNLLEMTSSLTDGEMPEQESKAPVSWWRRDSLFVRVAIIVFAIQGFVLLAISDWLFSHYDLTWDYRVYYQAWYLIAHGHLNPIIDGAIGHFWQNHLEWIMWPMALLYYVYPHGITLLVIQDLAIVGTEVVALVLMRDIIGNRLRSNDCTWWWLQWVGLVCLAFDPWFYWSAMFDFHPHAIYAFFITAAVWQFYRRHVLSGYIFVFLCFVTSDVGVTFLVPLGVLLFFWRQRRNGMIIVAVGIIGFVVEQHIFFHGLGGLGIGLSNSALKSTKNTHRSFLALTTEGLMVRLLGLIPRSIWANRLNVYANFGPSGLFGILTPVGLLIPGLALAEAAIGGTFFIEPGTQNIPAYALLAVGTIVVLMWLASKSTFISKVVSCFIVTNALLWMFTGIAGLSNRTAVPNASASASLSYIHRIIPASAEVVASQGIMGRFSGRQYIRMFRAQGSVIPVKSKSVYFIVSPYNGIDISPVSEELSRIAFLASQPNMQLVTDKGYIWAFKWVPPPGVHSITIGGNATTLPAWAMESAVGNPVVKGKVGSWYMKNSIGKTGYIESGAYWRLKPGKYQLNVKMASDGPVNVEVWNSTEGVMLLRRTVPATSDVSDITADFTNQKQYPLHVFKGWGPFSFEPVSKLSPYDNIEVRIWTSGRDVSRLYSIGIN